APQEAPHNPRALRAARRAGRPPAAATLAPAAGTRTTDCSEVFALSLPSSARGAGGARLAARRFEAGSGINNACIALFAPVQRLSHPLDLILAAAGPASRRFQRA